MKHLIQKILKEEFNPDDLTSPDINMSPATELEVAKSKYGWFDQPRHLKNDLDKKRRKF